MKKSVLLLIFALAAARVSLADTRLIGAVDIYDVWQYNYNASHWIEQADLRVGKPMWGEQPFTIEQLSSEMAGADWLQTAYGSKAFAGETVATFIVKEDVWVFLAVSDRLNPRPEWMQGYVATPHTLKNSAGDTFTFYRSRFRKGETVRLGANGSTVHPMYLVAVKPVVTLPPVAMPAGKLIDVARAGAVGDGKTVNTAALQAAIDKCSASKSGGIVYIHDGIFVTGTLRLKDNVTLWVAPGAILRGSAEHDDFPPIRCSLPSFRGKEDFQMIYAENARNITITGGGIIDGYSVFEGWPWKGRDNEYERPRLIRMVQCDDVTLRDITLIRSANWTQYYEGCNRLTAEDITIRCYTGTNNQDGIDVSGCRDVVLRNFNAICGDDVICVKSLSMLRGENILVDGVRSRYANCNIVKIGTETHGGVKNMTVRNVEGWTRYALAIEAVDGAVVEDITYENITLYSCASPFVVRLGDRGRKFEGGPDPAPVGVIRNVTFRNIVNLDAHGMYVDMRGGPGVGAPIAGIPGHPVQNVLIEDCDLLFYGSINDRDFVYRDVPENINKYPEFNIYGTCPAWGLYFRHVEGVICRNVTLRLKNSDVRPAVVMDDVTDYSLSNVSFDSFPSTEPYSLWHKSDGEIPVSK